MAAGKPHPMGPCQEKWDATSATVALTAAGVAGDGVSRRKRSPSISPVSVSTGAPLIPVPPISMPRISTIVTFLASATDHDYVSIGRSLIGRSIPYFRALWQGDKCFIASPMQCTVGTKQRKSRSGYSREVARTPSPLSPGGEVREGISQE